MDETHKLVADLLEHEYTKLYKLHRRALFGQATPQDEKDLVKLVHSYGAIDEEQYRVYLTGNVHNDFIQLCICLAGSMLERAHDLRMGRVAEEYFKQRDAHKADA